MASVSVASAAPSLDKRWKSFSLLFYRAVRDLKPVWMLEEMRTMEAFYQEDDLKQRTYTPSEALLYAIVHDHQPYARFLLGRYPEEALAKPSERFWCCPSSAPHLTMAVRYDRFCILRLILHESRVRLHTEDVRTLLHLACELQRPEAVVILLGSGASPQAVDQNGSTPLDVTLEKLRETSSGLATQCLDVLLMFTPKVRFKMRAALEAEPGLWRELLGENTFGYLAKKSPAPLVLIAMQTVVKQLSPATILDSLQELPIPTSLKPPGLPMARRARQQLI
ncbi:ankyrin repeat domain-containing protein 9 [Takifugu flavidus]|uniref:Ankyrin repeat domain-containing protein 9 n=1 Tax=Takifugu flavidus TaxID=433684 RepID=A0A5C6NMU9_9TELE|nr:ankyrin repeat domain-containing protein 9 [Takifugu flavidus]TWW68255.1 Ankyrin repeat domain-containing protein 9 [Takifugu flavidus]